MWRADSGVPEVAPAPASASSNPDPVPTIGSAISPVIAPGPGVGSQLSGRDPAMIGLGRLLKYKYKGKSGHRLRNGIMMVLGLGLVAGAVKLFVSSDAPKGATASAAAPATDPTPATPAPKAKSFASGTAMLTPTKPTGGAPTASSGIKPQNTLSDSRNTKPTAKARPAPKPSAALAGTLGPDHVDKGAGYAVRFPAGWTKRGLSGKGNWLAEATDGKSSSMAVGLGPDGGHGAADQQNLDALTKSFQANPNTTVEASGFGTIAGRKCMWHKLSVPSPAGTDGADTAAGRTTAVIYFAPLGDGRALKVRVVARPEKFAETAPTMKHSIDTLRLLDRQATAQ